LSIELDRQAGDEVTAVTGRLYHADKLGAGGGKLKSVVNALDARRITIENSGTDIDDLRQIALGPANAPIQIEAGRLRLIAEAIAVS